MTAGATSAHRPGGEVGRGRRTRPTGFDDVEADDGCGGGGDDVCDVDVHLCRWWPPGPLGRPATAGGGGGGSACWPSGWEIEGRHTGRTIFIQAVTRPTLGKLIKKVKTHTETQTLMKIKIAEGVELDVDEDTQC